MSSASSSQSSNAAVRSKAKPSPTPSTNSTKKFRSAGQPAGKTSTSEQAKMLGDNRYNPNPSQTTTDPFALPPFPEKQKMDGDDRSSVSDTDETVQANSDGKPAPGKKTRGRVRIQMEYIQNKLRRYTTFSKRKSGIMKKAYELSTLTGTQVMLLVASETGHVYTFATPKLQPMITSETGKALIQTCLHQPDPPMSIASMAAGEFDVRMSATGYEETELSYAGLPESEDGYKALDGVPQVNPVSSSVAPMHTIVNPSSIVSVPHGAMMPSFVDATSIMGPIHQMHHHVQPSPPPSMSPPHHSPPPSYSPPQPGSPPRNFTSTSYPGSPPSVTPYSQSSHTTHQPVMMEELHSPSHLAIESYERSPSRSPIRYSSPHAVHSPQVLYTTSGSSPPMGHCHSPSMRI